MLVKDFDFTLPPELIAQEAKPKGTSRMMVVTPHGGDSEITHATIADFPSLLRDGDVVVVNDTKVIPARLFAAPKGNMQRTIEVFLTRHVGPNEWECWCKPARRIEPGDVLRFGDKLQATVRSRTEDGFRIHFSISRDAATPADIWNEIENLGVMPLPPYIQREEPRDEDRAAYQTVYAEREGAIAAPTAGLHFTQELLEEVARRAELLRLTLHVGVGTFKPVKVERVSEHRMDPEWFEISDETAWRINLARREGRRVIAIGTTTVRALESASQHGETSSGAAETSIFITPGYRFRCVDALLTNFHLPQSTLLMLVSAFAGIATIRRAYAAAIDEKYRFYSFGDCMFITRRG